MAIEPKYVDLGEGKKAIECDADGKAVFVDTEKPADDGSQAFAVDVVATYLSVPQLRGEAQASRLALKDAEKKITAFKDIDPEKAKAALETVQNLKEGDLIKANDVEQLKKQYTESFSLEKKSILEAASSKEADFVKELSEKDNVIRGLLISSQFAKSAFFVGEKPKTILPPEVAETFYGSFFKVEQVDGKAAAVAYLNGEKVYSRERPGSLASFDEAMAKIIDASPNKNRILAASGGGPGGQGQNFSSSNGSGVLKVTREMMKNPEYYREVQEKKRKGEISGWEYVTA